MNAEWSQKNKTMQQALKKATFADGIRELLELREMLMQEMISWKETLSRTDFDAIPYLNAEGYHSKTVAYSIWHVFRIEDIVVNTLIRKQEEVLFTQGFLEKTQSPVITTGNELVKEEIAEFSQKLDLDGLYAYARAVREETDAWLKTIAYSDLKCSFDETDRERIRNLRVVSTDENAAWLIDYWCGKDIKGLLKMPLSRHWIMHVEAAIRIIQRIKKN